MLEAWKLFQMVVKGSKPPVLSLRFDSLSKVTYQSNSLIGDFFLLAYADAGMPCILKINC